DDGVTACREVPDAERAEIVGIGGGLRSARRSSVDPAHTHGHADCNGTGLIQHGTVDGRALDQRERQIARPLRVLSTDGCRNEAWFREPQSTTRGSRDYQLEVTVIAREDRLGSFATLHRHAHAPQRRRVSRDDTATRDEWRNV